MTVHAVPQRAKASQRLRIALGADAVAVAGLAVLGVLLAAVAWGTWGDLDSDTGYDVVAGALVADGRLPYVDFVYYYGPLAPLLAGLVSAIAGPGVGAIVALGLAFTAAIVAATYALARTFVGPLGAFLAAALTTAVAFAPNNYSYVLPHTISATLGTLFLLTLLLCLRRLGARETLPWAAAAGTALGLLALTKPEPALAGAAATAAWLVARAWSGRRVRRDAIVLAGVGLAIPALVYGAFLTAVSPHRLVLENLVPLDTLSAGGDVLVRARMPLTAGSFVELGGRALLYALGVAVLLGVARLADRPGRPRRVAVGLVVLGGLLAVAAAIVNPEALRHGLQFVYGWVPLGAAVAAVVLLVRARRAPASEVGDLRVAAAVALAVVAATAYNGFFLHAPFPQMAVYYAPLIAVFLVHLHLKTLARTRAAALLGALWLAFLVAAGVGLTLKDAGAESVVVRGEEGSLAETPAEATLYAGALAQIERETVPGERILVLPLLTGLEALSGRTPALPELSVLPGVLDRPGGERDAIAYLDAHPVRLVVTDDRTWPAYGRGAFGQDFGRELAAWITRNYERVAAVSAGTARPRTLTVWRRTGE
jgi:hypothetical protein